MEPIKIKHALEERGYRQTKLAKELEVSKSMVYLTINKKTTSKRIQDRICQIIGYTFEEVWKK